MTTLTNDLFTSDIELSLDNEVGGDNKIVHDKGPQDFIVSGALELAFYLPFHGE